MEKQTCKIVNDVCFDEEHDTDDGYCKECGNVKPNPYFDEVDN